MKRFLLVFSLLCLAGPGFAQKFMTRTGKITFLSSTPVEDIEAVNNEAACAMDFASGKLQFVVPIKSFRFEKALMQEHFNENYMESDKYPKAEFSGQVANLASVDLTKDGTYPVKATGKMTIHGVTRDVTVPGELIVKNGSFTVKATFPISCKDYNIQVPSVVSAKIAQQIKVTVVAPLNPTGR